MPFSSDPGPPKKRCIFPAGSSARWFCPRHFVGRLRTRFAVCNLIEGLINHHLLQGHQMLKRFLQNWKWWDFGFFATGGRDARVRVLA
ncbi:DUF2243 domain-containing protein [Pseudotabrizicola sediminis]|uniref:DUF2243 domain-containing protein n=1 Tax=Pseudotabrizicola sediminis TaxID=2486418 RepID=A0ABY2KMM3_9RHOB|nr:DUF2243 domain-containing protein [Pseudotabrizicola sediminis]TGD43821.1 DUF2243 domain-containing protein [Pseudotabrizicola sediminis]